MSFKPANQHHTPPVPSHCLISCSLFALFASGKHAKKPSPVTTCSFSLTFKRKSLLFLLNFTECFKYNYTSNKINTQEPCLQWFTNTFTMSMLISTSAAAEKANNWIYYIYTANKTTRHGQMNKLLQAARAHVRVYDVGPVAFVCSHLCSHPLLSCLSPVLHQHRHRALVPLSSCKVWVFSNRTPPVWLHGKLR